MGVATSWRTKVEDMSNHFDRIHEAVVQLSSKGQRRATSRNAFVTDVSCALLVTRHSFRDSEVSKQVSSFALKHFKQRYVTYSLLSHYLFIYCT